MNMISDLPESTIIILNDDNDEQTYYFNNFDNIFNNIELKYKKFIFIKSSFDLNKNNIKISKIILKRLQFKNFKKTQKFYLQVYIINLDKNHKYYCLRQSLISLMYGFY
jgi:hypothetical protein